MKRLRHYKPTQTQLIMQAQVKLSDALFSTAEAVVAMGKKSGLDIKITDVYKKENLEGLAMVSGLIRQLAEKSKGVTIEVLNT